MPIGLRCFKKCLEGSVFCSSISAKFSINQVMRISVNFVVVNAKYSDSVHLRSGGY